MTASRASHKIVPWLLSLVGLLLLWSICAAVQANLEWMPRSLLLLPRLPFYLWTGVAVALLLVLRGVVMERAVVFSSLEFVEGLLMAGVGIALIVIASGWRIVTDMGPVDPIHGLSDLPTAMRILADPWASYTFLGLVAVVAFFLLRRRGRSAA